jgi:hypothetical protein
MEEALMDWSRIRSDQGMNDHYMPVTRIRTERKGPKALKMHRGPVVWGCNLVVTKDFTLNTEQIHGIVNVVIDRRRGAGSGYFVQRFANKANLRYVTLEWRKR